MILDNLPTRSKILDLCCGTGQLAQELTARGYQVVGVDISSEMIELARLNAPNAEFIVQDARDFYFPESFDCVVSTYDSLNHILDFDGLTSVFLNVYSLLRTDGIFAFDLNTEAGYLYHWPDCAFHILEDDHACIVQSYYNGDDQLARFDATIFRRIDGWQRSDVSIFQRCYSDTRIKDALETTGFVEIDIYGFHDEVGLGELTEQSERAYYVCRKP